MSYTDYQNEVSSEKLTLAILEASNRLMAWTLHSGSVYKLENFDVASIVSVEDSGTAYQEVSDLASVTASRFYNDRENKILYIRTTGGDNPNGRFLVLTRRLFFANAPIVLPCDLNTGSDVYWEPMLRSTSVFGVEIDTIQQSGDAIEGSGTLTLHNDQELWPAIFDKLTFENRTCLVYSFNRSLAPQDAKLIFRGTVEKKEFKSTEVKFNLKDMLSALQAPVSLSTISELGERTVAGLAMAKQRMIFGRVFGHRPVNLDEVLDGYPITGTVNATIGLDVISGTGTAFLAELSPDDTLILDGVDYRIGNVISDTSATLTEAYAGTLDLTNASATLKPDQPKRWMNRRWHVAGHSVRQPTTTTLSGSTILRLNVASTKDMYDGDLIYVGDLGSGELVQIDRVVSSKILKLQLSLETIPATGVTVFKPGIQNLRIDDVLLRYERDYAFNPTTSIITLTEAAELNAGPLRKMPNDLTFTSGSRIVSGTNLAALVKAGSVVSAVGFAEFFEVLSVDGDDQVTLRSPSTFSGTAAGLYKTFVLDPDESVLTCDCFGRTSTGTPTGDLIDTGPKVIEQLLVDCGLEDYLDTPSFTATKALSEQPVGFCIPAEFSDDESPTYRDTINRVTRSIFGSLVQTNAFMLSLIVLQADKRTDALRLDEADILDVSIQSVGEKLIKTAVVTYRPQEYNYLTKDESISTQQKTSDTASHLLKTNRERTFATVLVNSVDAERHANRWSFLLESASATIKVKTKLQGIQLEVGSVIDVHHRKIYERFGTQSKRVLALVESVKKSGTGVEISAVDLSNMFSRVAAYTNSDLAWSDADSETRLYGGHFTDEFGLIDNDPESFGSNLFW